MPKVCLTPEVVDTIESPTKGEIWIADNHLAHFGVRAWAGKRGGGKAYCIRLRDQFGILVRESYQADSAYPMYYWEWQRAWEKPLGFFLDDARAWARDRIAIHLGNLTSQERERRLWAQRKSRTLSTTLEVAINRKLVKLKKRSKDHVYLDQIASLIFQHVSVDIMAHTFRDLPIRALADAISNRSISDGNVKALRAFVGGVLKDAAASYAPLHHKLESIQRRCAQNLDARIAPPHPRILQITDRDYQRFFDMLDADGNWRPSLAIRFYFATGAKLQTVLRARWSDILEGVWYPFLPDERKLWLESREHLGAEALSVLGKLERRHAVEKIFSPYLFPSLTDTASPIKTVQRHWSRHSDALGWTSLPMSHVVLRHRPRLNPSYSLFFIRTYILFDIQKGQQAVSKVGNRRKEKLINASTYR